MSKTKGNHTVPKCYLKQFSTDVLNSDKGQLGILNLSEPERIIKSSVKRTGRENGFYSQEYEDKFNKIEQKYSLAIDKLLESDKPPDDTEKDVIAKFITLQCLRTPGEKGVAAYLYESPRTYYRYTKAVEKLNRMANSGCAHTSMKKQMKEVMSILTPLHKLPEPTREDHMRILGWRFPSLYENIINRQWVWIDFYERGLFTSDSPIGRTPSRIGKSKYIDVGYTSDILTFPVSRKSCLIFLKMGAFPNQTSNSILWQNFDVRSPGTVMLHEFVTNLTLDAARQQVYYHPDDYQWIPRNIPNPIRHHDIMDDRPRPWLENFVKRDSESLDESC